jgi:hypothetical protein
MIIPLVFAVIRIQAIAHYRGTGDVGWRLHSGVDHLRPIGVHQKFADHVFSTGRDPHLVFG